MKQYFLKKSQSFSLQNVYIKYDIVGRDVGRDDFCFVLKFGNDFILEANCLVKILISFGVCVRMNARDKETI